MSYDNSASKPNQSTSKTGSVKPAKGKAAKPKTTKTAKPKAATGLYSWDGGPAVHTIDQRTHNQNVGAAKYGIDLNAPASQPLDNRTAYGIAQAAAGRAYDPQIQAAQQMGANVQPWFQSYLDRSIGAQKAAAAYAAPIVQQAQTWANQAPTAAPGLDPNSAAGQQSQQAATSGQSLAQLGYATLAAIPVATNAYMSGQQDTAARQVAPAQAFYGKQVGDLQGQKGQATADEYGKIRTNEQNAQIAYNTLDLNQNKAAAETDIQRGVDPVTGKKLPSKPKTGYGPGAPGLNKYGYTADEWGKLSPKGQQKVRSAGATAKAQTQADKQAVKDKAAADKAAAKKKVAIQKATGTVTNKVTDIIQKWTSPATVDEVTTTTDPTTGLSKSEKKSRPATPQEHRQALIDKYGFLGRIAIAVHEGRALDQKAVDYLHHLDPNFRVPHAWIEGKKGAKKAETYNQRVKNNEVAGPLAPGRP